VRGERRQPGADALMGLRTWLRNAILRKVVSQMAPTWLGRLQKGELGWKSVTGSLLLAIAALLEFTGVITMEQFLGILALGSSVLGIGLRDALAKLQNK
jgi:hypothetical protein